MRVGTRILTAIFIAACLAGAVSPARSQQPGAAVPESTSQPGPPPEPQSQQVSEWRIEEIVVTARRRSESIQRVPLSVTAFDEDALSGLQVDNLGGIQNAVPNLVLHKGDAENTVAYIRGIGQVDSLAFAEPGVGIYLDGVYLARTQGAFLDVFDVERIEVLRGPQGTLYGRNTIGGAVKFVSRRPTQETEARLEAGFGNHGFTIARGRLSGGLGDSLLAKAAISYAARDGFSTNNRNSEDDGDLNSIAWRASALYAASPAFDLELTLDGSSDSPDTSRTPARLTQVFGVDGGVVSTPAAADPFRIEADFNNLDDLGTLGATLTANWEIAPELILKSITAWRKMDYDTNLDLDATRLPAFGVWVRQEQRQFSQEFNLIYDPDGIWRLTGGLYWFQDDDDTFNGIHGPALALTVGGGTAFAFHSASTNDQDTNAIAGYFQLDLDLSERLTSTLGLRYTNEEKDFKRRQESYTAQQASSIPPPFPNGGTLITTVDTDEKWNAWTPRLAFDYELSDSSIAYLSVSRGFKSGGFDGRSNTPFDAKPYDPEYVWSYETGLKNSWTGGRYIANMALFYNDYEDLQLSSFDVNDMGTFEAQFTNAGEARIFGAELEFSALPIPELEIRGSIGWLDAEYQEFIGENGRDISGEREMVNAPEWSGALSARIHLPVFGGILTLSVDGTWRDKTYPVVSSSEILAQDSYAMLQSLLSFRSGSGRWELRLGAKNLTDEEYITHGFDLTAFPGYQLAYYGAPRTYDLRLIWRL